MRINLRVQGSVIAARDRVRELLRAAEKTDRPVLLSAAGLTFISRSAAAELLDAVRRWRTAGRFVEWQYVGTDIAKMLRAVDSSVDIDIVEGGER